MNWERVHTVNEYYDCPRFGVADLCGTPHIYHSQFNHTTDEYDDVFLVAPIAHDLLALVLEDWHIWLRWHAAYTAGQVPLTSHPALPEDLQRHEDLRRLIGSRFTVDSVAAKRFTARFRVVEGETQVLWSAADA